MAYHKVKVHIGRDTLTYQVEESTNLLGFLRNNSFNVSSTCGGKGKCGKCRIKVKGLKGVISEHEKKLLGIRTIEQGYRLACINKIDSELDIYLDEVSIKANIITSGKTRAVDLNPSMNKRYLEITPPSLEDQASDLDRIEVSFNIPAQLTIDVLRSLPALLRDNAFKVTGLIYDNKLVAVEPGDTSSRMFGIAMDIGTTTLAAYLYDLCSGKKLGEASALNPQRIFGADVLSRIDYTAKDKQKEQEMHKSLIKGINGLIKELSQNCRISSDEIYQAVFVGNTTMTHFLLNLPAGNIAVSPFIPVTTRLSTCTASQLGININKHGFAVVYPCVSGYIGADSVAAVLSSGMHETDGYSLLIDIGTNGEIVFGGNKGLYACSTAAGPAFEGANIKCGVGGIAGAVDKVFFDNKLKYTTIGNLDPIGICGSGVVDAIAVMLEQGIIDETGRILDYDECTDVPPELAGRLVELDGMKAIRLASRNNDEDLVITQKDIRELQNAKAAIAAGVSTLIKRAGASLGDIRKVYLAGGFGNYINVDSAVRIGLIPAVLRDKVESIGNAAGEGAIAGLLSREMISQAVEISNSIEYIELSSSAEFVDEYINNMTFANN
jgi:uncharacterized 2Fe-2S/4Fe-4S cluster protein (DUF4445 family)